MSASVLPTHVGMSRGTFDAGDTANRAPHTRGDEPNTGVT